MSCKHRVHQTGLEVKQRPCSGEHAQDRRPLGRKRRRRRECRCALDQHLLRSAELLVPEDERAELEPCKPFAEPALASSANALLAFVPHARRCRQAVGLVEAR